MEILRIIHNYHQPQQDGKYFSQNQSQGFFLRDHRWLEFPSVFFEIIVQGVPCVPRNNHSNNQEIVLLISLPDDLSWFEKSSARRIQILLPDPDVVILRGYQQAQPGGCYVLVTEHHRWFFQLQYLYPALSTVQWYSAHLDEKVWQWSDCCWYSQAGYHRLISRQQNPAHFLPLCRDSDEEQFGLKKFPSVVVHPEDTIQTYPYRILHR